MRDLEGELDGMRRKSREVLQQAVWAERERMTNLQWELDDCRVVLQATEENAQSLQVLLQPMTAYKISMRGGRV